MPVTMHSSEDLTRFIEAAGESANIDAKGPMEWDGGEASAGLTKDILALANSRDGGVIVVRKDEPEDGKFVLTGLTEPQASSWVVKSLEASLWAFHDAGTFEEAVLRAVNLGDDADTTGAICGQLAGACWGESQIPDSLLSGLARMDMLESALAGILAGNTKAE